MRAHVVGGGVEDELRRDALHRPLVRTVYGQYKSSVRKRKRLCELFVERRGAAEAVRLEDRDDTSVGEYPAHGGERRVRLKRCGWKTATMRRSGNILRTVESVADISFGWCP